MNNTILLGHGSGGKMSHELISNLFLKYFRPLDKELFLTDSALIPVSGHSCTFTTDSYVVNPIFFPGGNIGKLAVCGTVNDLSVSGSKPAYLSASFIIEEGFAITELETIVSTMAEEAHKAGVRIITGDTKIVNKGQCDKVFINTAGIGFIEERYANISSGVSIEKGDKIIINGSLGDHAIAVLGARNELHIDPDITSDCASLNELIRSVIKKDIEVKFMRDVTRGGLATVLCELTEQSSLGTEINEQDIPVKEKVRGVCELLGFDPLYLANEGKVMMVVKEHDADKVIDIMRNHPLGAESIIIGEMVDNHPGMNVLHTRIGGKRIIDMLAGEQLPRIC
jgi:hydrogenase expression/formation protein HypE